MLYSKKSSNTFAFRLETLRDTLLILAGVAGLTMIFQLCSVAFMRVFPAKPVDPSMVATPQAMANELIPYENFEQKMKARNIFFFQPKASSKPAEAGILEKVKDLALIGIVKTGNMEAILKDKKTNRTTFVRVGQRIGELEVKQIKESSIILKSKDNETELFLS
ncbi:MAG TPA: hypothetical protein PKL97_03435 [Candidatus Omnitrophota bacterium]|nr:hypothetical protein [Candidatus Omnitrophota bacterium]